MDLSLNLGGSPVVVLHLIESRARVHQLVLGVLAAPPSEQAREALCRRVDGPVELRGHVVDPSVVEPELGVRVNSIVLIESSDSRRIARS